MSSGYSTYPHNRRGPLELPTARSRRHGAPDKYQPDSGLVDAVNAALLLGQPLLLTGAPGVGKTQLAFHLSYDLGLGAPLIFSAKSTSTAKDLFYLYDSLARFHAAQFGGDGAATDVRHYIQYSALGLAILYASPPEEIQRFVPTHFVHGEQRRSVVLIDEIDKAPRDFPNDILNEIEDLSFTVPELGGERISAPDHLQPVIVLTSNSERRLPEPFLRRCIYYDVPFPEADRLRNIVLARVEWLKDEFDPFLRQTLELFEVIRGIEGLSRPPATAELLGWLEYLGRALPENDRHLRHHPAVLRSSLGVVAKTTDDQQLVKATVEDWIAQQ